ncbi:apolipoprotein N-acyltransferase [Massilia psychrophila]|uniref:Apolipoprotein N-acyltransferase n=1 Tax=Massilia psychrophila TaxID=1603353 RepID=A0A2G8T6V4_9BURK|nr:apolipoprotein N-acyltransferase [Massilia psychrophila]PIL41790.1 apolipoprotein N-acyltransferase [Massilia psychrophila]GGE60108.1 apolipoprotein N-acyltransferase [Massilia psychrophila]
MPRRPGAATAIAGAAGATPRGTAMPMLLAALAGGLSLFTFAPFGAWPLQFPLLAFLFYQVGMDTSVKRATLIGWAFGLGWSVAGMHWLYIAMNRFGGLAAPLAALAIVLLGAYMGLFAAFATGVAAWLRRRWSLPVAAFLMLALPVSWGLSEWMRGWVFTGFPWAASGYAHNASPLAGFAPLVGVYGIGVLVALGASCLTMLTQRARWPAIGLLCALMATGYGLRAIDWTRPHGAPISVRLLQGSVAQGEKFEAEYIHKALALYRDLIIAAPADLIATPETAIVLFPQQLPPDYLPSLARFARDTGSSLMYGIPFSDSPTQFTNSVAGISPSGQTYRFDKQHLVPFGEFVPQGFRWFVDMMQIPLGDFNRGAAIQPPFAVKDQLVLPNVCYEDAFGEEIASQLRGSPRPATILLNASNLAWYGESVAIPQHLQISRMRSLETGRPMLRATNTGATAVIDAHGNVTAVLPFYGRGVLSASVQGMQGMTPYIRFGNLLFLALAALALATAWYSGKKYRTSTVSLAK